MQGLGRETDRLQKSEGGDLAGVCVVGYEYSTEECNVSMIIYMGTHSLFYFSLYLLWITSFIALINMSLFISMLRAGQV